MVAATLPPLLVVTGPTASGKTRCAVSLARAFGGELVGADSVQIYRGFDIGSSKPTAEELGDVRHHLLDIVDATTDIDAARFAQYADEAIADVRARGAVPIVVGGSGLWLRALLRGLVKLPPVDLALRQRLMVEAAEKGARALHDRLLRVDPRAGAQLHPNDRTRVVRALEVFEQTGVPLGEHQAAHALGSPRYRALRMVLTIPPKELDERIRTRTHSMVQAGFAREVSGLVERFGRDVRPLSAVGYREMVQHVCDGVPIDLAQEQIIRATRVYARRQRTWLNNEPGERWLTSPETALSEAGLERLKVFFRGSP